MGLVLIGYIGFVANQLLIKNCGQLLTMKGQAPKIGKNMSNLGLQKDAFVFCEDGFISKVGKMKDLARFLRARKITRVKELDAQGKVVMPGLIDCHTHLVFAGSRAAEFKMKLEGKSYLEILAAGGGILSTVKATRKAGKRELLGKAVQHLEEMLKMGVTTVEIKSGYGLDKKTELKIFAVVEELKKLTSKGGQHIVGTFLGAHTVPPEYKGRSDEYLEYLVEEVLPEVRGKADFVDIFCEKKAFSVRQSRKYLEKARELGFGLKIHSEQINRLGGSKLAAKLGATSMDHCDQLKKRDIRKIVKLSKGKTIAVLLPLVPLYLREEKYADGRYMIDAGLPVAVSTDFNPGSAPSKNLFLAMTFACLKMGLTPEESLSAVTINAACALGLQEEIGSVVAGKRADLVIMRTDDYRDLPYWMGENLVSQVVLGGSVKRL